VAISYVEDLAARYYMKEGYLVSQMDECQNKVAAKVQNPALFAQCSM
jgi:hypothetical protein